MKRLNIYNGLILAFAVVLPVAWVCRGPVILPDIGSGKMCRVHEVSAVEGMADITLHSVGNSDRTLLNDSIGDAELGRFDNEASIFGNNKQVSFSAPAQRLISPQARHSNGRDSDKDGLFGADKIDPFSAMDAQQDSPSWGWLSDDVQSAERDAFTKDSRFGGRQEPRRLFDNDDAAFGKHFGGDNSSGGDSYFKRQDLRW